METRRMSARLALAAASATLSAEPTLTASPARGPARTRKQQQPPTASAVPTRTRTAAAASATAKPAAPAAPSRKRTRSAVDDDDNDDGAHGQQVDAKPASAKRARTTPTATAAAGVGSTRASRLRAASTAASTAAKSAAAAKEKAATQAKVSGRMAKRAEVSIKKAAAGRGAAAKATAKGQKGSAPSKAVDEAEPAAGEEESELSDLDDGVASEPVQRATEKEEERQRTIRFAPEPIVFDTSKDVADRPPPRRVASRPSHVPAAAAAVEGETTPNGAEDAMDVDSPVAAASEGVDSTQGEVAKKPVVDDAGTEPTERKEDDMMQVDQPTATLDAHDIHPASAPPSSVTASATSADPAGPNTPTKPAAPLASSFSTPSRAATPLKSALRTPNTLSRLRPATPRSATFSPHLTRQAETYSPAEYDRSTLENTTKDLRSAGKINRDNWIKIIRSVDRFKVKEMQVHPESKANTRVHLPHAVSPGGDGSDGGEAEEEEAEEFRLFDGSPLKAKTTVGHVNVMETAAKVMAEAEEASEGETKSEAAAGENAKEEPSTTTTVPAATPNARRVLFPLASTNTNTVKTAPPTKSPGTPTKEGPVAAATPLKSPARLIGSVFGSVGSLISRLTPSRKSVEDLIAERQQ